MSNDTITVCPQCDSAALRHRTGGSMFREPSEHKHRCKDCGHEFDNPNRRESQLEDSHTPETILKRLGVDPDEAMIGGAD